MKKLALIAGVAAFAFPMIASAGGCSQSYYLFLLLFILLIRLKFNVRTLYDLFMNKYK